MDSVIATNPVSANPAVANPALANPALAKTDALPLITNSLPPALASLLSSASVKSALEKAPSADVVKLSDQALQLQVAEGLLGNRDASTADSSTALGSIFARISAPIPVSTTSRPAAAAATPSPEVASQLGIFQGQLQAENTPALFAASAAASGSNVNLLG
jgi:hypothetical protein